MVCFSIYYDFKNIIEIQTTENGPKVRWVKILHQMVFTYRRIQENQTEANRTV